MASIINGINGGVASISIRNMWHIKWHQYGENVKYGVMAII
jgi:hypothetical protein